MANIMPLLIIAGSLGYITTVLKHTPVFENRFVNDRSKVKVGGSVVNPVVGDVKFRWQPEGATCNTTSGPFILAMVPSSVQNKQRRNWIRNTWANYKYYNYTTLRTVFVVGQTMNKTLQNLLDEEATQNRDILQYNFIDSYRNLTYKTTSWLTWAASHCHNVTFITKADDDVVLNPFQLRAFLLDILKNPPSTPMNQQFERKVVLDPDGEKVKPMECIYGRVGTFHKPSRKGKWALTTEEYPESMYPAFVLGPSYIVGMGAVRRLVKYAPFIPMIPLEDVYATGLVAHAAGIPRVLTTDYYHLKPPFQKFHAPKVFLTEQSEKVRKAAWESVIKTTKLKL